MQLFRAIVGTLLAVLTSLHDYLSMNNIRKKWNVRRALYAVKQKDRIAAANKRKSSKRSKLSKTSK